MEKMYDACLVGDRVLEAVVVGRMNGVGGLVMWGIPIHQCKASPPS